MEASSVSGVRGVDGQSVYAATKAAVRSFGRSFANIAAGALGVGLGDIKTASPGRARATARFPPSRDRSPTRRGKGLVFEIKLTWRRKACRNPDPDCSFPKSSGSPALILSARALTASASRTRAQVTRPVYNMLDGAAHNALGQPNAPRAPERSSQSFHRSGASATPARVIRVAAAAQRQHANTSAHDN
jgi:hypothetical protein